MLHFNKMTPSLAFLVPVVWTVLEGTPQGNTMFGAATFQTRPLRRSSTSTSGSAGRYLAINRANGSDSAAVHSAAGRFLGNGQDFPSSSSPTTCPSI